MVRTKTVREKSQKQEKRTAKQFNGLTQIASGAIWSMKADVRSVDYLIENKYTDSNFYTLNIKTWNKIFKEATNDNLRIPLMQIDIKDKSCIVCEESYLDMLVEDFNVARIFVKDLNKSFRITYELLKALNTKISMCGIDGFIQVSCLDFKQPKRKIKLAIIDLNIFLELIEAYNRDK